MNKNGLTLYRSPRYTVIALLGFLLISGVATSCKPTEKNYRSAYDVANEKRERDNMEREERSREMGLSEGMLNDYPGVSIIGIGDSTVYSKHLNFQRADSVADYAVSVATFRMESNAGAMAADLNRDKWHGCRALKAQDLFYIIIGDVSQPEETLPVIDKFKKENPDWQYVGQPGPLVIIGGSR